LPHRYISPLNKKEAELQEVAARAEETDIPEGNKRKKGK